MHKNSTHGILETCADFSSYLEPETTVASSNGKLGVLVAVLLLLSAAGYAVVPANSPVGKVLAVIVPTQSVAANEEMKAEEPALAIGPPAGEGRPAKTIFLPDAQAAGITKGAANAAQQQQLTQRR